MMTAFHNGLTPEELSSLQFAHRVAYVEKVVNRPGSADVAVELVKANSDEAAEINRVLLKEVEKAEVQADQDCRDDAR